MGFCGYKYRFGLYAAHSNIINSEETAHFHNFTIALYIHANNKNDDNFEVEKSVQDWLEPFHGQHLAKMELFSGKETTLEGMGEVFFEPLYDLIEKLGYELVRLDIYENPIRVYSVSRKLLDSSVNQINSIPLKCIPTIAISNEKEIEKEQVLNMLLDDLIATSLEAEKDDQAVNEAKSIEAVIEEVILEPISTEELQMQKNLLNKAKAKKRRKTVIKSLLGIFMGIGALILLSVVTMYIVKTSGRYSQDSGTDLFCHLYRADLILKNISQGNWYPLYDSSWYNGVEIMRYWGPVPLYIVAGLEWIAQNSVLDAYLLYLGLMILIGGCGWLLWGCRYKRIGLSIVLGLLWFYMPENMRVVINDGNLPRGVINALLPYFFYFLWRMLADKKKNAMWGLIVVTAMITLCHLGITLMLIATVAIFIGIYSKMNRIHKWGFCTLGGCISGVLLAGIWVVPALIGGAASGASTNQVMKNFFESAAVSLNPFTRLNGDMLSFYFGLSVFIICLLGIILGTKKVKPGFVTAIILLLCTTKSAYVLLAKMPFSQFLWMIRFVPIGLAAAMVSFIMWKQLKKWMVVVCCIMLIVDCATSINYIYFPQEKRVADIVTALDEKAEGLMLTDAKNITNQRLAVMDLSKYGSFAPYYIAGVGKNVRYTFGAGWEGAATATEIVRLNTSVESGWYGYLFDRALELGNDTVLIPVNNLKEKAKDVEIVIEKAALSGYTLVKNSGGSLLFHKDVPKQFGVITKYKNIAIGTSAAGIAMMFPSFEEGTKTNLNDYTFEELSRYESIYLSGFTYDDQDKAEALLLKLSESGIQVYVDMNNIPADRATKQKQLLGVNAQSISFTETYPEFEYNGNFYKSLDFSADTGEWNTIYLNGLDNVDGYCNMTSKKIPYIGTVKNENLHFIGLNIIYYLETTRDSEIKKLVGSIFKTDENAVPNRTVVPITVTTENNRIEIYSEYDNVDTALSSLDIFSSNHAYRTKNNLIVVDSGVTVIDIGYPHLMKGILVTIVGLILACLTYVYMLKMKEIDENEEK